MQADGVCRDVFNELRAIILERMTDTDGVKGLGISRKEFFTALNKIETELVKPLVAYRSNVKDSVEWMRTQSSLAAMGQTQEKINKLESFSANLKNRLEIETNERTMGLVARFSDTYPLGLPSRLYSIANELELNSPGMDVDEKKLYLTLGVYVMLEFTYNEDEITLEIMFALNEEGDTRQLVEEAEDILSTLKCTPSVGRSALVLKLRAIFRRARLEVALKAGPLRDLEANLESALECRRVARGLVVESPLLPTTCNATSNFSTVRVQTEVERQRIYAEISPKESDGTTWQSRCVIALVLEPPVPMTVSIATKLKELGGNLSNFSTHDTISLYTRLGQSSKNTLCLFAHSRQQKIRLVVDDEANNESVVLRHLYVEPNLYANVAEMVLVIQQQVRFNLLLGSCVHTPLMVFSDDLRGRELTTLPMKRKRVLQCNARRELMKKTPLNSSFTDIQSHLQFDAVVEEKECTIKCAFPLITFALNNETVLDISVDENGHVVSSSGESIINKSNNLLVALHRVLFN